MDKLLSRNIYDAQVRDRMAAKAIVPGGVKKIKSLAEVNQMLLAAGMSREEIAGNLAKRHPGMSADVLRGVFTNGPRTKTKL